MKHLRYKLLPPVGPGDEEVSGTVVELIQSLPYLLMTRVPPRAVINSVLKQGTLDRGMSGGAQWDSFELDEEDYIAIANHLETTGLTRVDPPNWVCSQEDWMIWQMQEDFDIPADEHRRMSYICTELDHRLKEAERAGHREEAKVLHVQYFEACSELSEFIDQYMNR